MKFIGWFDKQPAFMVSTIHNFATFEKDVRARGTGGETRNVVKPIMVELYTKNMGGVDRADQLAQYITKSYTEV